VVENMHSFLRHLTLNRIGAGLFVSGILLLVGGVVGLLNSVASDGRSTVHIVGLTGGQALLVGLASLVFSAVFFALAVTQERLARLEAKLDAAARGRVLEEPAPGGSA
jgi:hypothetical protein